MKWKIGTKKVIIPVAIVVVVLLIVGGAFYFYKKSNSSSSPAAVNKAISYIDQTFLSSGVTAQLASSTEKSGVYEFTFSIQGNTYTAYVTKDGKILFPDAYDMSSTTISAASSTPEAVKSDKPDVNLYVMSFCPYGNQAEETMLPVYNLLKDDATWNVHFIVSVSGNTVSSLHGPGEVTEDEREACVLKNSGVDKWWQFATYVDENCGSDGSCWQTAAQNAGLSVSEINSCVSSQGLSLMEQEASSTEQAGVSGSPTLFINGVENDAVYQYGNSQAYLDAVCSSFNNQPQGCSQQITTSSANASSGGSCGN